MPLQDMLPPADNAHRIERASLKDTAARYIRDLIFNGNLRPGVRIDQDAIAETLGVSKLPVREALIALEASALVDVIPRRGAFVANITKNDLVDHYRIYASVSMISAERAAGNLAESDLERLRSNLTEMKITPKRAEREALNHEFHRIINLAGGSRRLHVFMRGLDTMMFGEFYRGDHGWIDTAIEDHEAILFALRRGDGDDAAEHMKRHIVDGGAHAISILEEQGFWED